MEACAGSGFLLSHGVPVLQVGVVGALGNKQNPHSASPSLGVHRVLPGPGPHWHLPAPSRLGATGSDSDPARSRSRYGKSVEEEN